MKKTLLAIALAATTFAANANDSVLDIAVGGKSNMYHQQAIAFVAENSESLKDEGYTSVKYHFTGGTQEIAKMINKGAADIGFMQQSYYKANETSLSNMWVSGKAFIEPVYAMCNKDEENKRDKVTGYSGFKDSDTKVGIVRKSGAQSVWKRAHQLDNNLNATVSFNYKNESRLMRDLYSGKIDCAMVVSGAKSAKLKKIDKKAGKFVRIVPFDGYALNNSGEFNHIEISSSSFENIIGNWDVDSIADIAVMAVNNDNDALIDIASDYLIFNRDAIREISGDDLVEAD